MRLFISAFCGAKKCGFCVLVSCSCQCHSEKIRPVFSSGKTETEIASRYSKGRFQVDPNYFSGEFEEFL